MSEDGWSELGITLASLFVDAHRDILDIDRNLWSQIQRGQDGDAWQSGDLRVIWSIAKEEDGRMWIHVSVSRSSRLPSYTDMTRVKDVFIGSMRPAYTVMPRHTEHVNIHANCLHLWAPFDGIDALPDFTRGGKSI